MKDLVQQSGYVLDLVHNVWIRPNYQGIAYSDGHEVEARLASTIKNATDLSVLSTELRKHCVDWASLYHLSSARANIVRPFERHLKCDVLEIGAGCGAITRYLGECGANVLALEGSPTRASIARSRTRDLENVTVLAEKFDQFRCERQFDVVTLIGVLEYAGMFTPGDEPALSMLERVRSLLKPNGRLIIAIENQLGLKYFAGAPEDHLGQPMVGIEGRYQKGQPQTFGRNVLAGLLKRAGFTEASFLAPFPDYKLPISIVTEQGFLQENFDAGAFAWQSVRRDPQLPQLCNFSLELAWPEVVDNKIGLDLANSFLVVASPTEADLVESDILAFHYSTERAPKYCKETFFVNDRVSGVKVNYRPLAEMQPANQNHSESIIRFVCSESDRYVLGKTLSIEFVRLLTRDGWSYEDVARLIWRHLAIVKTILSSTGLTLDLTSPYSRLPGEFFDVVFNNIIIAESGESYFCDREWSLATEIELGHILFRALLLVLHSITRFGRHRVHESVTRHQFVDGVLTAAGFKLTDEDCERYLEIESVIQEEVTGRPASNFLDWRQDHPLFTSFLTLGGQQVEIHRLLGTVAERDERLLILNERTTQLERDLARQAEQATELAKQHNQLRLESHAAHVELDLIRSSTTWRALGAVRSIGSHIPRGGRLQLRRTAKALWWAATPHRMPARIRFLRERRAAELQVATTAVAISPPTDVRSPDRNDYCEWIRRYDTLDEGKRSIIRSEIAGMPAQQLISVVMPVYNPNLKWLGDAIESVRDQLYPHWELCIADDASTNADVRPFLEEYAAKDPRIKVIFRECNGHISAASNSALELATGTWVALMDQDDLLPEHALYWAADAIIRNPEAKLIYSDEDKIDDEGRRHNPYFKCDWNLDLFYSQNMFNHLGLYQKALLDSIGGFRTGVEGSQDYDLVLRCMERVGEAAIHHIPRVLYHWRVHAASTAASGDAKPYAALAGERALNEHFARQRMACRAEWSGYGYRVRYALPVTEPLVSLIIPTRNGLKLIRQCIDSIVQKTTYANYEIIIVDNGSNDPETLSYFASLAGNARIRILRDDRPFNYSALNNGAVSQAKGELIGLVNNDIEVRSPEWLSEMVSLSVQPSVGVVGAKLLYPDDTLQHGGVVLGIGGVAGHANKHAKPPHHGYFCKTGLLGSFSAVTAACLVVRKSVYSEVGGLNENDLTVAFNDVDFCLRAREAGYRNVWTPYAELYHHESATRGYEDSPQKQARFEAEAAYMRRRWGQLLLRDPAYSPNLTLDHEDFSLAWPPRLEGFL